MVEDQTPEIRFWNSLLTTPGTNGYPRVGGVVFSEHLVQLDVGSVIVLFKVNQSFQKRYNTPGDKKNMKTNSLQHKKAEIFKPFFIFAQILEFVQF